MSRGAKWFSLLVAAQVAFLLGWAGYHEVVRHGAPVVVLKAKPVDPQDLLRGDYLRLRFDISDAPIEGADGHGAVSPAQSNDVWVLLEPRGRYHVAVRASRSSLDPGPGQVLVRGRMAPSFGRRSPGIEYGIERYYVPEGRGSPRFQLMEVEAAVGFSHRLSIRRLLLDGRPYP